MLRFVDALKSLGHNRARRQRLGKRVAVVSDFNQQRAGGNMLVKAPVLDLDLAAEAWRERIGRIRDSLRQSKVLRPVRPLVKAGTRRATLFPPLYAPLYASRCTSIQ